VPKEARDASTVPAAVDLDMAGQLETPEKIGNPVQIDVPNVIHFGFDRSDLDEASRVVLDSIADMLEGQPSVRVQIYGHTDTRGSVAYNEELGRRRASAARAFLAERGIDPSRLEVVARGEADAYRKDAREEIDHARNRRVEMFFIDLAGVPIRTHRQERDLKPKAAPLRDGQTPPLPWAAGHNLPVPVGTCAGGDPVLGSPTMFGYDALSCSRTMI